MKRLFQKLATRYRDMNQRLRAWFDYEIYPERKPNAFDDHGLF
jgi:hypothetical protein